MASIGFSFAPTFALRHAIMLRRFIPNRALRSLRRYGRAESKELPKATSCILKIRTEYPSQLESCATDVTISTELSVSAGYLAQS